MTKAVLFIIASLGFLACKPEQVEPDKATRHCLDKGRNVVSESQCEAHAGGSSDFVWWYLMYQATMGSRVSGGYASPPSQGFVPYARAAAPSHVTPHVAAPAPASTPRAVSNSAPSFSLPKSSAPVRTQASPSYSPSYSRPSHSYGYSSPSYSRPSSGSSVGSSSARSR